jgi:hypothetical protein
MSDRGLIFGVFGIVMGLLVWLFVWSGLRHDERRAECEKRGGEYVSTRSGDHCVRPLK